MKKIKVLKPLVGAYKMAYFGGEVIEVNEALAQDMVSEGFAEIVESEIEKPIENATEPQPKKEKAVKK